MPDSPVPHFVFPQPTRLPLKPVMRHFAVGRQMFVDCLLINARSINNKLSDLHALLDTVKPGCTFVVESWLSDSIPDTMLINTNQYHVFRRDRTSSTGGGVCAFVDKKFTVYEVEVKQNVELVAFDMVFSDIKYRFIVCYRKPSYDALAREYMVTLISCLSTLCSVNYSVTLIGDFNLPNVNWNDSSTTALSDEVHIPFIEFTREFGFEQYVSEATRNNNILDIVLVNDPLMVVDCKVNAPLGNSDHDIVEFRLALADNIGDVHDDMERTCVYDFDHADYEALNMFMSSVDWTSVFEGAQNVNDYWSRFAFVLNTGIAAHTPTKIVSNTNLKYFKVYPLYIRQLVRKKRFAWRLYKRGRSQHLKDKYLAVRRKCDNAISSFTQLKEARIVNSGNLGLLYKHINSKLTHKSGVGLLKRADGSLVHDDLEKANFLNDHFGSVFTNDNDILPPMARRTEFELGNVAFTPELVWKQLCKLKTSASAGPDKLPPRVLKELASSLASPLSWLFTVSFTLSSIPDIWRIAIITPIFKKGLASDVSNYRPISLTCIVCKVMESIVRDQMLTYLLTNDLITSQQHGFLKRHSTSSQLLECIDDWSLAVNSKLGMLIPGYLDTRVPCGLPGSRKTSKLPSYRDRLHQSNDCPCGHIQTELLFISVLCVYICIKYVIYSSNKSV